MLVEGPLNNLQPSMIQFSKPRKTLSKPLDQFRRHEINAREALGGLNGIMGDGRRSGTPSRFDASFYRTHDPLAYISSDTQSLRSQATYTSGLPSFAMTGSPYGAAMQRSGAGTKRNAYGSYASSVISQDVGATGLNDASSIVDGVAPSERGSSVAYSQSDRLRRRPSLSSVAGASDIGSVSQFEYKSQEDASDLDDMKSQYAASGVTVY